jgi:tRNA (guanine-N7-)-methyltransferase
VSEPRYNDAMSESVPVAAGSPLRLDPERAIAGLDWVEVFGSSGRVEVEIGIGKGRFLLDIAQARPEVHHLGVEWANEYLKIAETRAMKRGLGNVRFVRVDARELVARGIPPASVDTYYVFYPDPWPKKRHHKRRFFQRTTVDHVARTLKPGGGLHVATDHEEYWSSLEPLLDSHPAFARLPAFGGDDFPLPADAPLTNFEAKYEVQGRGRHRGSWRRRAG